MRRIGIVSTVLSAFVFLLGSASSWAAPLGTLTFYEPLGVEWADELVSQDLAFKPGDLAQPTLAAAEKGKALPCQVTDVVRHADGTVASLKVWLMVTVGANQSREIAFTKAGAAPKETGVTVTEEGGAYLLTTEAPKRIGIRVPRGGAAHDWPVAVSEVPAPIQGLLLPSGAMTAPSVLDLPFRVVSWSSEIVNSGPLFTDVRIRYNFDTGYWVTTLRMVGGRAMIRMTEEVNTGATDVEAKGFTRFHRIPLTGKGFAPETVFLAGFNQDDRYSGVVKNGRDTEYLKKCGVRPNWFASQIQGYALKGAPEGTHYYLSGYPTHQQRIGGLMRVVAGNGDAVGFAGLRTEDWRNPLSIRLIKGKDGVLSANFPVQKYKQAWPIDGFGDGSPNYTGITIGVPNTTCRRTVGIMLSNSKDEKTELLASLFTEARKESVFRFDSVRGWKYEWKDSRAPKAAAAEMTPAAQKAYDYMANRLDFFRRYGVMSIYSMGLHFGFAHGQYKDVKAAMEKPEDFTAERFEHMRRLLTFHAGFMNSEASFPYGTGFHLNNPNMTIMASEARFVSSVLVKDHPDYLTWGRRTVKILQGFFERFSRPSGAAYENPHYVLGATLGFIAPINETMMENGLDDVFDTPRFRKMIRFAIDWIGPPDPRFYGVRTVLPLGNCSYQSVPKSMSEPLIRYFKDRHPGLAGKMQWMANQTYAPEHKIAIVKDIVPDLKSVVYEGDGVSFRHGFGTPYETLMRFRAGDCDGHYEWEQDQMAYTLYAKGQPINLNFANGYFPMWCRPWLRNRVSFDMKFEISERNKTEVMATALGAEVDYLKARRDVDQLGTLTEYPDLDKRRKWTKKERDGWTTMRANPEDIEFCSWYRQVMFLKDKDPKGPNYFVIADNFGGTPTRPTDVNFWFLANGMTQKGNVLSYEGQLDVNMDVFVHTPATFTPHTDSYGHQEQLYGALFKWDKTKHPNGKRWEEQKLLRIRQAPGKGYLTVLYPRLKEGDPAASYKRLADHVVEVATPLSRDVVMMRAFPFEYKGKDFTFSGRSGAVRTYKDGRIVVLNNEGVASFTVAGKTIEGTGPFQVTLKDGKATTTKLDPEATVTVK
ncbi:MAG: hypothetical protein ACYTGH_12880 [Planctomycetota bacterium]|jgi:hypothetical protein